MYALFQHELKRLLAFHSIENVGIIVLGLGACLVLRARGADAWAGFALAAALLHTVNHALFKSLLFLGAGSFERAVGSLELDRLGGLVRRMPWTGGAFLVGAIAIAGLPPLNGFASEWVTLQSLLRVPAYGGVADGTAGAIALGALAATAALAALCFVKVVGLVLLGPARRDSVANAQRGARRDARRVSWLSRGRACCSASPRAALRVAGRARAVGASARRPRSASTCPGRGRCGRVGSRSPWSASRPPWPPSGAGERRRPRRPGRAGSSWSAGSTGRARDSPSRSGSCSRTCSGPSASIVVRTEGGIVQEVVYEGRVPHLFEERLYRPLTSLAMQGAHQARRMQSGRLGTYVGYLVGLVLVVLAAAKLGVIG